MNTLGERLIYIRKENKLTQDSLAELIGVSRGVIFNLEKNKAKPQVIVINAICQNLKINKKWLLYGIGEIENNNTSNSSKIITEIVEITNDLSENQLLYLLNTIRIFKKYLDEEVQNRN